MACVRSVLKGITCFSPAISREAIDLSCFQNLEFMDRSERLTKRRTEVIEQFAAGKSMKEVANPPIPRPASVVVTFNPNKVKATSRAMITSTMFVRR